MAPRNASDPSSGVCDDQIRSSCVLTAQCLHLPCTDPAQMSPKSVWGTHRNPDVCRLLLDKLDGAVERYSAARQWHFLEICLGMAIAVVLFYVCHLWYQGALSK